MKPVPSPPAAFKRGRHASGGGPPPTMGPMPPIPGPAAPSQPPATLPYLRTGASWDRIMVVSDARSEMQRPASSGGPGFSPADQSRPMASFFTGAILRYARLALDLSDPPVKTEAGAGPQPNRVAETSPVLEVGRMVDENELLQTVSIWNHQSLKETEELLNKEPRKRSGLPQAIDRAILHMTSGFPIKGRDSLGIMGPRYKLVVFVFDELEAGQEGDYFRYDDVGSFPVELRNVIIDAYANCNKSFRRLDVELIKVLCSEPFETTRYLYDLAPHVWLSLRHVPLGYLEFGAAFNLAQSHLNLQVLRLDNSIGPDPIRIAFRGDCKGCFVTDSAVDRKKPIFNLDHYGDREILVKLVPGAVKEEDGNAAPHCKHRGVIITISDDIIRLPSFLLETTQNSAASSDFSTVSKRLILHPVPADPCVQVHCFAPAPATPPPPPPVKEEDVKMEEAAPTELVLEDLTDTVRSTLAPLKAFAKQQLTVGDRDDVLGAMKIFKILGNDRGHLFPDRTEAEAADDFVVLCKRIYAFVDERKSGSNEHGLLANAVQTQLTELAGTPLATPKHHSLIPFKLTQLRQLGRILPSGAAHPPAYLTPPTDTTKGSTEPPPPKKRAIDDPRKPISYLRVAPNPAEQQEQQVWRQRQEGPEKSLWGWHVRIHRAAMNPAVAARIIGRQDLDGRREGMNLEEPEKPTRGREGKGGLIPIAFD
ncbi:hypothetical protein HDU96_007510 [Phlyctochytrium bullatum]|nr:hypothetical protein HDU96_007510 [Phlyctochytrium bullatum]